MSGKKTVGHISTMAHLQLHLSDKEKQVFQVASEKFETLPSNRGR